MSSYESLIQVIQRYLANHTTVAPVFAELVEMEVCDEVLARRMTQDQANEILDMVA